VTDPRARLNQAFDLLQAGRLEEAVPILEQYLADYPNDVDALYNLGMAQSDLGQLDAAKHLLGRLVDLEPRHVNARVALGVAYQRSGDAEEARRHLTAAVVQDPSNGYAQRNLGAVLGNLGLHQEAEAHLRAAHRQLPKDLAATYGLAACLEQLASADQLQEADRLYHEVIDQAPGSQLADLAERALTRMAQRSFDSALPGAVRPDAMMYCLGALERFETMSRQQVQQVAFEIAMLGRSGLDTNNPDKRYQLRSVPGDFSGLQLVAMMYVGFKRIEPSMDIGFDLAKEYEAALKLHAKQGPLA
jgi:tetratricopeptide (TPR) repeat protein